MTTSMQMVNNTSKLYEIVLIKIRCGQSQMEKPILEKMTFEEHKKITMQTIYSEKPKNNTLDIQ